jgi:hypothetical protein
MEGLWQRLPRQPGGLALADLTVPSGRRARVTTKGLLPPIAGTVMCPAKQGTGRGQACGNVARRLRRGRAGRIGGKADQN